MLLEFFGEQENKYISTVPKFNLIFGIFKLVVNRFSHKKYEMDSLGIDSKITLYKS